MGAPWDFDGLVLQSGPERSCGAGCLFLVLPWVSLVVVDPTPAWLLPGPSNVVQVTSPCTRSQLLGSGAANAGAARAKTIKAAETNTTMRLIKMFLSLATSVAS